MEVEVDYLVAMAFFSREFQDAVARGDVTLEFAFVTLEGVPSTAGNYVANVQRFFNADASGWQVS